MPLGSRATAIGTHGFVTALAYLPSSVMAGVLWKVFGPRVAFGTAAVIATASLVYFVVFEPKARDRLPPACVP
ncbi:MAG: hypothetical protein ACXWP4_25350 [Polyangiales bacterium]